MGIHPTHPLAIQEVQNLEQIVDINIEALELFFREMVFDLIGKRNQPLKVLMDFLCLFSPDKEDVNVGCLEFQSTTSMRWAERSFSLPVEALPLPRSRREGKRQNDVRLWPTSPNSFSPHRTPNGHWPKNIRYAEGKGNVLSL